MVCADNQCTWIATGNNPRLSDEIARRTVLIRLDADAEHPDQRTGFRHPNLKQWLSNNRGELVWAALVAVKAWVDAGSPPWRERQLGGFESWSETLGGILKTMAVSGFLEDIKEFRDDIDNHSRELRCFVHAWWNGFQDKPVTVTALLPHAVGLDLGPTGGRGASIRLGRLLGGHQEQIVDGFRIHREHTSRGYQMWRLLPVASGR
jgi:hypothetical protein